MNRAELFAHGVRPFDPKATKRLTPTISTRVIPTRTFDMLDIQI